MDNKKRIIISLRDSFTWILLTTIIGLIQLILYLMVSAFSSENNFSFYAWIENGAIVSFSLALVSSIFLDTHFQKHHQKMNIKLATLREKYFGSLFYKLLPWLVVLMVTFTTMLDIFVASEKLHKDYLQNTQIAGVALAYIYTIYYKYCYFYIGMRNDI